MVPLWCLSVVQGEGSERGLGIEDESAIGTGVGVIEIGLGRIEKEVVGRIEIGEEEEVEVVIRVMDQAVERIEVETGVGEWEAAVTVIGTGEAGGTGRGGDPDLGTGDKSVTMNEYRSVVAITAEQTLTLSVMKYSLMC